MAIAYLGCDGFDNGTFKLPYVDRNNDNQDTVNQNPKTGVYSCRIQYTDGWIQYPMSGNPANPSVGLWVYPNTGYDDDSSICIRFHLTSGEYVGVRWDGTNHTFDAYVDGVKVADGTANAVKTNRYFNVQVYAVIDNAGSIQCKVQGVEVLNYSGDTLPDGATAQVDYFYIWCIPNVGFATYVDNIVWGTGGYTGDVRVEYLPPTADTGVDDWTASAGDSYSCIDEVPKNDADYIYSSGNGEAVELDLTDWTGTGFTPVMVGAWARMQEDVATGESIKVGVDSGGTDDTTEHVATDDWEHNPHFMDDNPDDSLPWEDADIDALKLRYEAVI